MILIIGGACQGKLNWTRRAYHLLDGEILACTPDSAPDFSFRCISGLQEYVYGCMLRGEDAVQSFRSNSAQWQDSVLICRDIFSGVVPMDAQLRRWREETGRLCQYLAAEAEQVYRIFCGMEQRLK